MRIVKRSITLAGLLLFVCCSAFAASADDVKKEFEDQGTSERSITGIPAADLGGKSASMPDVQTGAEAGGGRDYRDYMDLQEMRKAYEKGMMGIEEKTTGEPLQKSIKIVLNVEPGDGLATLNW